MSFFLIVLLAVLVACFFLSGSFPRLARGLGIAAALAGILAGGVAILRSGDNTGAYDLSLDEACGVMLGQELKQRFPQGGNVLVLRHPEGEDPPGRMSAARFTGLESSVGDGVTFHQATSLEPWTSLRELHAAVPNAIAVVSLLPLLEDLAPEKLTGMPPLYCFVIGREDLDALFASGRLHAAIAFRDYSPRPPELPRKPSPEQLFQSRYKLLTQAR